LGDYRKENIYCHIGTAEVQDDDDDDHDDNHDDDVYN